MLPPRLIALVAKSILGEASLWLLLLSFCERCCWVGRNWGLVWIQAHKPARERPSHLPATSLSPVADEPWRLRGPDTHVFCAKHPCFWVEVHLHQPSLAQLIPCGQLSRMLDIFTTLTYKVDWNPYPFGFHSLYIHDISDSGDINPRLFCGKEMFITIRLGNVGNYVDTLLCCNS